MKHSHLYKRNEQALTAQSRDHLERVVRPKPTRCLNCKQPRDNHRAGTLNCPTGKKRHGTFWTFSETQFFRSNDAGHSPRE